MPSEADWTREALEREGFIGWHCFGDLRPELRAIDRAAGGVYVVYREATDEPVWLDKSTGGTWRGDPSVARDELVSNWGDGAHVATSARRTTASYATGSAPTAHSASEARDGTVV